jgi:3-carboxy-cis,cis-muconate cycloisomerase
MQSLYETIFYSPRVNVLFSDDSTIGYMLRFEGALAQAQARYGIIPDSAAALIHSCCRVENIHKQQLIADAGLGGNLTIPLVKQLTAAVKQINPEAARYVHFGATSQDVIDTAMMMQLQDAVRLIDEDLQELVLQLTTLAETHRNTIMIGRSFMQQARPITFGYKVAGWIDPLLRSKNSTKELLDDGFVLQLGGAVGTLSGMQEHGLAISETMSSLLGLNHPVKPWHTTRDWFSTIATFLGILTGNLGKMAKDISLLMQTEVAEVLEPAANGKGGSSTMPHKRNPVGCIAILANAARVPALVSTMLACMVQDHERATGYWHAEWETLSSIVQLTAGALGKAIEVTDGLEVRKEQMLHNLELTNGLIYAENITLALAPQMGKTDAHALIEQCCEEALSKGLHLKEVIVNHPAIIQLLTSEQVNALFNSVNSIGLCNVFINRVLNK